MKINKATKYPVLAAVFGSLSFAIRKFNKNSRLNFAPINSRIEQIN